MDEKTLTALQGSIAKWESIVAGPGEDLGVSNCPLCAEFFYKSCEGCPVAEKTGKNHCVETPYTRWFDFLDQCSEEMREDDLSGFEAYSPDALPLNYRDHAIKLAREELEFLRSLLPGVEVKDR